MLILIVVAASVALAAFVASYEKQYLANQAAAHDKSLENVQIVSVAPVENTSTPNADNYTSVSVVLGSLDVQNITVSELTLNGLPVAFFTVQPLGSSSVTQVCYVCGTPAVPNFVLNPEEQVTAKFDLATWNSAHQNQGGMFTSYDLPFDHFIVISAFTTLGNDFTRTFYAPSAVIQLGETTQYIGSGTEQDMLVLNGLGSVNPPNATIAWWSWSFTPQTSLLNASFPAFPLLGQEVLVPQSDFPVCQSPDLTYNCPEYYNISLTVQDSDGLFGQSSIAYDGFSS